MWKRLKRWIIGLLMIYVLGIFQLHAENEADINIIRKLGYPYYTGEIIPKPKEARFEASFIDLADLTKQENNTCILLGKNPSSQERAAAVQLQKRLNSAFNADLQIQIINESEKIPSEYNVIISIGTTEANKLNAGLCEKENLKVSKTYPGTEGYVLLNSVNQDKTVVVCCGSDVLGSYYAVSSLNQLITVRDGKLLVRKARVIDWPTCLRRTAGASRATEEALDWMSAYKLNTYFQNYGGAKYWFNLLPESRKGTLDICRKAVENDVVKYEVIINPYTPYHNPGDPKNHKIKISDDADMQALIAHYRMFLEAGVRTIMLACDDFVWIDNLEFVLHYPEDKARFKDVADSHIYMANKVYSTLLKDYPDLQMFFCPSYYSEGHVTRWARKPELGRVYLDKIGRGMLPQIKIVLTGPRVLSPAINSEDVTRLRNYIGGRDWYLWDNTGSLYYTNRGGSEKPVGLFRPFTSQFPIELVKSYSNIFNSAISCHFSQERVRITQISIADYLWNPENYDPEWSLQQAINSYVGPGLAPLLIKFGDLFSAVDKSIAEINSSIASDSGKIVFEDSFEDDNIGKKWTYNDYMNTRLEKNDAKDGVQCAISESKQKGCMLRTKNKVISLQMEDLKKYAVDFFWKTTNPATALKICLMADGSKESYLHKKVKATDTEWNHYHIPLTDFEIVEAPKSPIGKITDIRFYRDGYKGILKPVTFKVDKVCLIEDKVENEKENQRFAAIEEFKKCFNEIKAKCWNKALVDNIKKFLFEPKIKTLERFYKKPSINVRKVEEPPVIDGKLDDGCWEKAEKTTLFKTINGNSKEITATCAMVVYDKDNLYVAFTCKADKWDDEDKLVKGRDGSIGVNDAVEIFIEPFSGSGEYFHLGANRSGGTMDQQRGRTNKEMIGIPQADASATGRKWNPDWNVKTLKGDGVWTAEIQIPLSAFGKKPIKKDVWGMNFCRSYTPGNEYGAWSCTYGGFHKPLFFGKAIFE